MTLSELKKEYSVFEKKYNLPTFSKMSEEFDIDHVAERDVEFLLREIRRYVNDKVMSYLRFIEMLLNPASAGAPMFLFSLTKLLSPEKRVQLEKTYAILARLNLDSLSLDIVSQEKEEAAFILRAHKQWKDVVESLQDVMKDFQENWDQESKRNTKSYFG